MSTVITANQGTYKYISTDSMLTVIRESLQTQGLTFTEITNRGGKIHTYRLHDINITDGISEMKGQIYFRNSEVPGTALMLYIGAYRFICANGLVLGVGEGGRLIHRVGPTADDFLGGIAPMIAVSIDRLQYDLQDTITESLATPVADPISIVGNLPIQNTVKDMFINRLYNNSLRDDSNNVWGLYNNVNELTRMRTKKANTAIGKDIGLLEHINLLNNSIERKVA